MGIWDLGFGDLRIWGFGILGFGDLGIWGFRASGLQGFEKNGEIGIQGFKGTGIEDWRFGDLGIPDFRFAMGCQSIG